MTVLLRAVAAALLWAAAFGAWAHATLVASDPADGVRLRQPPAQATLRFDEPVVPGLFRLLDRRGQPLPLPSPPSADGTDIRVALPDSLPEGHYVLAFRVTSTDSHVIGGALAFTVGDAAAVATPVVGAPDMTAQRLVRVVHLAALLAAAGAAMFVLFVAPPATAPLPGGFLLLPGAALLCAASALAAVWQQGVSLLDPSAGLFDAWRAGFATSRGDSALAALAGTALILAGTRYTRAHARDDLSLRAHARGALLSRSPARAGLLALGALLLVASPALSGHSATARPAAIVSTAAVVHVALAAFWFASLLLFGLAGAWWRVAGGRVALDCLQRFSALARPAVALLAIAAITLAWVHLRAAPPNEWLASEYGRWIALKVLLLAGLVALAALNRYRLLRAALGGSAAARRRLRASIGAELALFFAAIAAAAWLATTPPPRGTPSQAPGTSAVADGTRDGWRVRLVVAPARAGSNSLEVFIDAVGGSAREPKDLRVEFAQRAAGLTGLERTPVRVAPGHYRWTGAEFTFAGEWEIVVRARIDDFETREVPLTVRIDP